MNSSIAQFVKGAALAALMTAPLFSCAQFAYDYLKAADDYYAKGDFFSAATYYEKYVGSNAKAKVVGGEPYVVQQVASKASPRINKKELAIYHLAESYRRLNYPAKAEPYYAQAMAFGKDSYPLVPYYYGKMLKANGKFAEAQSVLSEFRSSYASADLISADTDRELANLSFISKQMGKTNLSKYQLSKLGAQLNREGASYAPSFLQNTLVFTSTREDRSAPDNRQHINRLYTAGLSDSGAGITRLSIPQPSDVHQAAATFTKDGNTAFITRWSVKDKGQKMASIYKSTLMNGQWSEPMPLDSHINQTGFSSQQPAISADGNWLLFSSNKPGGEGGFDLYGAPLSGGITGMPINLGTGINTSFDEQAPYYHGPSNTLVFASNGYTGMGGYDLFRTTGTPGNWTPPQNMGYPINSVRDDMYFATSNTRLLSNVVMSTDRASACCLELFGLTVTRSTKLVKAFVTDCDGNTSLTNATVIISNAKTGATLKTVRPNSDGSIEIMLDEAQDLKMTATLEGYKSGETLINIPYVSEEEESGRVDSFVDNRICLNKIPPPVDVPILLTNVYYDFNKADLKPESYPSLDEVVKLMNKYPDAVIEIGAHTDNKGSDAYNQKLSAARAQSVVNYLISKGISTERLRAIGYGESQPRAENNLPDGTDNPEGREQNRRTEFKVLSYDRPGVTPAP